MKINGKVHCFFEQSGTFKNEFIKLGIPAEDYDILNDFGQTDHVVDLFSEIEEAYNDGQSVFDGITENDLIVAFFPCTKFETLHYMNAKGNASQMTNWNEVKKLEYSMKKVDETNFFYAVLCKFVRVCLSRKIKLVIENPASKPHFLTDFFPIKPAIVHNDRTEYGDKFIKPTQYWFIGFQPEQNFVFENAKYCGKNELITRRNRILAGGVIKKDVSVKGKTRAEETVLKSMISPVYANRFIREYILEEEDGE